MAPRGSDEATADFGPARLLVRAAIPKVYESADITIIVDGIAELSALATRYVDMGSSGLLGGPHPYALVLADLDGLVLARNADGPPLYYARSRGGVLVASEPTALLAAGVPAVPDQATVERYLATGACDEVPATFFDGVRRVLPGQVVEIARHRDEGGGDGWAIRAHPPTRPRNWAATARMALLAALPRAGGSANDGLGERTGVLLGGDGPDAGLANATILGTALAEREGHRSTPVYSANFPGLSGTSSGFAAALLGPIPDGSVRHKALPFFADEIDVDGFLADMGEPVPDLSAYLLWAIARATGGEVDVLLSAAGWRGRVGHLSRIGDRIAARYGVTLRFPFADLGSTDDAQRAELLNLAERTLPAAAVRAATSLRLDPPLRDVLQRLRAEVINVLLYPRQGLADQQGLASLAGMAEAPVSEVDRVWRRYLLERWMCTVVAPHGKQPAPRRRDPVKGLVGADSRQWQRTLVPTEPFVSGDRLTEKVAWYVAEFGVAADRQTRQAMRQPWYVVLAGKPVAVAQGLAAAVWEIQPSRWARLLSRMACNTRLGDPWTMQVAIEHGGSLRMGAAAVAAKLGRGAWYEKIAGDVVLSVSPPREHACAPAHLAVVPPPRDPDQVADELMFALRRALPEEMFATLGGCAVVGVDRSGVRALGWAGDGRFPDRLVQGLCADNPFGQDDERTPILIAVNAAARKTPAPPARKGAKQPARRR